MSIVIYYNVQYSTQFQLSFSASVCHLLMNLPNLNGHFNEHNGLLQELGGVASAFLFSFT